MRISDWSSDVCSSDLPAELEGRLLTLGDLRATEGVTLPPRTPDRTLDFRLAGDMASYRWTLNGRPYEAGQLRDAAYQLRDGDRVRLRFENRSTMFHPMHLHEIGRSACRARVVTYV